MIATLLIILKILDQKVHSLPTVTVYKNVTMAERQKIRAALEEHKLPNISLRFSATWEHCKYGISFHNIIFQLNVCTGIF